MSDRVAGSPERAVVVSSAWWSPHSEAAFAIRSVAGAMSRHAEVEVVAPATRAGAAKVVADGLFDVQAVPRPGPEPLLVLVVADDAPARALAADTLGTSPLVVLATGAADGDGGDGGTSWSVGVGSGGSGGVGLHMPVNPLAAARPHNGLGFTDYLLVLTDRMGGETRASDDAPDGARWLAAAFPGHHLVVVEDGRATAWRCRALRGVVTVDSRTDLWRLMAHARVVIDLQPGPLVARECVEALRFGTPIIGPEGTPAASLAAAGAGQAFGDVDGLFGCVDRMDDDSTRNEWSARGREIADTRYGDAGAFVRRVGDAIAATAR